MDQPEDRLKTVSDYVLKKAHEGASTDRVTPIQSRHQKARLREAVAKNYVNLDELEYVFKDINSSSSLKYFSSEDAKLIRAAALSLAEARRSLRKLGQREWLKKSPSKD
tara:strand:+ start:230447 stop:230773 length:327 start_codon:yes stop_codon:yes gene_type:complete